MRLYTSVSVMTNFHSLLPQTVDSNAIRYTGNIEGVFEGEVSDYFLAI